MDPSPFQELTACPHDLLMVYDYRNLAAPAGLDDTLARYGGLFLVAWSMGVWAAGTLEVLQQAQLSSAVAVNGTTQPIDNRNGINAQAYQTMLERFSETVLHSFYTDMFDKPADRERFMRNLPQRPLPELKEELHTIRQAYHELGPSRDLYDTRLVGSRDRIVPARNQLRAWGRDRCTVMSLPHFPFYTHPDLDRIRQGDANDS